MGVRGLESYVSIRSQLGKCVVWTPDDGEFLGRKVVVDGSALLHYLYFQNTTAYPSQAMEYGCTPHMLHERTIKFLSALVAVANHVYVVMDGISPDSKEKERIKRSHRKLRDVMAVAAKVSSRQKTVSTRAFENCHVLAVWAHRTFVQAILNHFPTHERVCACCRSKVSVVSEDGIRQPSSKSLESSRCSQLFEGEMRCDQCRVRVWMAHGEADGLVATLATEMGAVVLSNDSDFYIYPVVSHGYVPLSTITLALDMNGRTCVTGVQYLPQTLAEHLGLSLSQLPLLATLCGTDYVDDDVSDEMHGRLCKLYPSPMGRSTKLGKVIGSVATFIIAHSITDDTADCPTLEKPDKLTGVRPNPNPRSARSNGEDDVVIIQTALELLRVGVQHRAHDNYRTSLSEYAIPICIPSPANSLVDTQQKESSPLSALASTSQTRSTTPPVPTTISVTPLAAAWVKSLMKDSSKNQTNRNKGRKNRYNSQKQELPRTEEPTAVNGVAKGNEDTHTCQQKSKIDKEKAEICACVAVCCGSSECDTAESLIVSLTSKAKLPNILPQPQCSIISDMDNSNVNRNTIPDNEIQSVLDLLPRRLRLLIQHARIDAWAVEALVLGLPFWPPICVEDFTRPSTWSCTRAARCGWFRVLSQFLSKTVSSETTKMSEVANVIPFPIDTLQEYTRVEASMKWGNQSRETVLSTRTVSSMISGALDRVGQNQSRETVLSTRTVSSMISGALDRVGQLSVVDRIQMLVKMMTLPTTSMEILEELGVIEDNLTRPLPHDERALRAAGQSMFVLALVSLMMHSDVALTEWHVRALIGACLCPHAHMIATPDNNSSPTIPMFFAPNPDLPMIHLYNQFMNTLVLLIDMSALLCTTLSVPSLHKMGVGSLPCVLWHMQQSRSQDKKSRKKKTRVAKWHKSQDFAVTRPLTTNRFSAMDTLPQQPKLSFNQSQHSKIANAKMFSNGKSYCSVDTQQPLKGVQTAEKDVNIKGDNDSSQLKRTQLHTAQKRNELHQPLCPACLSDPIITANMSFILERLCFLC
eukprot:CFRG5326T1